MTGLKVAHIALARSVAPDFDRARTCLEDLGLDANRAIGKNPIAYRRVEAGAPSRNGLRPGGVGRNGSEHLTVNGWRC